MALYTVTTSRISGVSINAGTCFGCCRKSGKGTAGRALGGCRSGALVAGDVAGTARSRGSETSEIARAAQIWYQVRVGWTAQAVGGGWSVTRRTSWIASVTSRSARVEVVSSPASTDAVYQYEIVSTLRALIAVGACASRAIGAAGHAETGAKHRARCVAGAFS